MDNTLKRAGWRTRRLNDWRGSTRCSRGILVVISPQCLGLGSMDSIKPGGYERGHWRGMTTLRDVRRSTRGDNVGPCP